MGPVTNFLLRWLYLSHLRDDPMIQTLPPQYYEHHNNNNNYYYHHVSTGGAGGVEEGLDEWKRQALQCVTSVSGAQARSYQIDALRMNCVQDLAQELSHAHDILRQHAESSGHYIHLEKLKLQQEDSNDEMFNLDSSRVYRDWRNRFIVTTADNNGDKSINMQHDDDRNKSSILSPPKRKITTRSVPKPPSINNANAINDDELARSLDILLDCKQYVPQLVSAVLHNYSTPSDSKFYMDPPLHELRSVLLRQCSYDPSFGILLCWLLEADVGSLWKEFLEFQEESGQRLSIYVAASDEHRARIAAQIVARIGREKQAAFELLNDAEDATAFGDNEYGYQLPESFSIARLFHFGDTMHFVDKLKELSIHLQSVPRIERTAELRKGLDELNRRTRRRMLSKGSVSLDVDDNVNEDGTPTAAEFDAKFTADMLLHSIHLPIEPETQSWPNGKPMNYETRCADRIEGGVVRILNIVVDEARVLASAERCPFLVRVEVVDSEVEASDARLYANGKNKLGISIREAIQIHLNNGCDDSSMGGKNTPFRIPSEVFTADDPEEEGDDSYSSSSSSYSLPRGGWQDDEYWTAGGGYVPDGYEYLYQSQMYQQHQEQQMYHLPEGTSSSPEHATSSMGNTTPLTQLTYSALLDHVFGDEWVKQCEEIKRKSPYGNCKGWRLASFIMKAGEDIRKEALVMQVISKIQTWFQEELPPHLRPMLRPYTIMCVGNNAGLVECLTDVKSIDELKKNCPGFTTLRDYFERAYGKPAMACAQSTATKQENVIHQHIQQQQRGLQHPQGLFPPPPPMMMETQSSSSKNNGLTFEEAQDNFLRSLVGYSIACYVLQVKDRHNANIMMDRKGRIIHIDFGFVLGEVPKSGKIPIFSERAPFKLTAEFWEVLGGWKGKGAQFCRMFDAAFTCLARHSDELATMIEEALLNISRSRTDGRLIGDGVRRRLTMKGPPGSTVQKEFTAELVSAALTSWGTSTYDWLQRSMHGYQ